MKKIIFVLFAFIATLSFGQSWQNLGNVSTGGLFSVYFQNATTGYAGGFQYVYKTTDGGTSWTEVSGITVSSNFFERINFLDANFGYIIGRSRSFVTTDGGSTWTDMTTSSKGNDGVFLSTTKGICVGDYQPTFANIRMTNDGGSSWSDVNNSSASQTNKGISFYNSTNGVIVGANKQVLKTTDAGSTWNIISGSNITGYVLPQFESIVFVSGTTGYAVANSSSMEYHGWIYKTTDGGNHWFEVDSVLADLNAVFFIDDLHGYIGGSNGYIYYTNDGGNNWSSQSSHTTGEIRDFYFINSTTGFAVAENGDFLKFDKNSGIEAENNQNEISVFPNPVDDKLNVVYYDNITNKQISVYDITGNLVFTQELLKNVNTIKVNQLQTGIYFYKISQNGELLKTGKIQKL